MSLLYRSVSLVNGLPDSAAKPLSIMLVKDLFVSRFYKFDQMLAKHTLPTLVPGLFAIWLETSLVEFCIEDQPNSCKRH